ncbi:hypothetical protein [Polaromonas sp. YR568]|uniref:hypothetical protein n=1 Tax=Polaromonas sp. YR568 TaxID=1855301 RepID=UPI00398BD502
MTKISNYPLSTFIGWYVLLGLIMVGAKFLEQQAPGGDAYSLVSNVLGLVLLLPWIVIVPGGHLGQGINSAQWFLVLSLLNLFLLIGVSALIFRIKNRRVQ